MSNILYAKDGVLFCRQGHALTAVIPHGPDALHVISVPEGELKLKPRYALSHPLSERQTQPEIRFFEETRQVVSNFPGVKEVRVPCASIRNGDLTAIFEASGKLVFRDASGKVLLEEYARNRLDSASKDLSALEISGREFIPHAGSSYTLTARFEACEGEKLYGMGQYQQPYLNLKGCTLELAQRNSQASVPFLVSSRGYGFLWNNPAVGTVTFARNVTEWKAHVTDSLDYWVTAGKTPAAIEEHYAAVTGTVPLMPDYALGFWQSKLRYRTSEELIAVAEEYRKRGLPLDVIVLDFFHWPHQGDWDFDRTFFPDPERLVARLKELNVRLMVSVWPTVERASVNFGALNERGYLIHTRRGLNYVMDFMAPTTHFDATNPEARAFVYDIIRKNYVQKGVRSFWLDVAEPEYAVYDFDHYRYHAGSCLEVGNLYPVEYVRTFYEGLTADGEEGVVSLTRCAWAGAQKYGALVWSGDIAPTFEALRNQIAAGLNMGLAGIPWWTTDIGGFHGGNPQDPAYRELFARWFEWGTFCPVMRVHGDREPRQERLGTTGGSVCCSGGPNEVYAYGEEVLAICTEHLKLRVRLKPYLKECMREAHERGTPVMRPLFYDFPGDAEAWEVEDEHLLGPAFLICPVYEAGQREKRVYLPAGAQWRHLSSGEVSEGGRYVTVPAPLSEIPVFVREGFKVF